MVRDKKKLEIATHYRKSGFSYSQIAKLCGVSKSTVSKWLSNEQFSKKVKEENLLRSRRENAVRLKLMNKAREKQQQRYYKEAEKTAVTEFRHYKHSHLFTAGLAVYISLGSLDTKQPIRLSTSRQEAHRIFIAFAREFLGVTNKDVRFWLACDSEQSVNDCEKRWSKVIGVPVSKFHRTQINHRNKQGSTLHFGVGNTIIGKLVLKRKLQVWVKSALKQWK